MDLTMESRNETLTEAGSSVLTSPETCDTTESETTIVVSNKKETRQPKTTRRRKLTKHESLPLDNLSSIHTRSSKISESFSSSEPVTQAGPTKLLAEEPKAECNSVEDNKTLVKTPVTTASPDRDETVQNALVPGRQNVLDGRQTAAAVESSVPALQPPVLQALGLSRGLGIGVGLANTINLSKSAVLGPEQNRTAQTSAVSSATSTLAKTVPLLLNMPGAVGSGASCVPSLLPANLPPGRYVIISSTSASPSSPLATITTTTSCGQSAPAASLAVAALQASTTSASLSVSTAPPMPATVHKRSVTRLSPAGGGLKSSIRASVGKTRGMRKSYTNSEKLAMIEAVESGLRKSVVADKFGVAPSTLACIILQKEKIRRDQTKSSLSRRRIRPSSDSTLSGLSSLQYHAGAGAQAYAGDAPDCGSREGEYCKGESGAADGGHGGEHLSSRTRSPPPFTHFLANLDQSMTFDAAQAEEIVSVPDLTQSLSFTSDGGGGCSPASPLCTPGYCPPVVSSASPLCPASQSCSRGDPSERMGQHPQQEAAPDNEGEAELCHADPPAGDAPPTASGPSRPRNPSHAAKNVSVLDRVHEFGDILMTDPSGQTLLCWACGFRLDHTRRSTIVEHLRSRKHGRCYLVAQALKTYALSSLGSTSLPLDLVKEEPDSCLAKESGCLPEVECSVTDGSSLHTGTSGDACAAEEHASAGAPKPTNEEAANVEPVAADAAAESQLSGLCLVKREVHCYSVLDQLLKDQAYTDVTITADGHTFYAHKVVLCVASGYFRRVLANQTPGVRSVVVFRDVQGQEMKNILQFLYTGEATVDASDLASFMRTAQMLEITSLCDEKFQMPSTPPAAAALTSPAPSCDPLLNLNSLFSSNVSGNLGGLYPASGMPGATSNPSPNLNTLFSSTNALPIVTNALRQQGLLNHQTMSQLQQMQTQKQQQQQQQQVVVEQLQHLREQLHATCSQMLIQSGEENLKTSTESTPSNKENYSSEVQDLTYVKTPKASFETQLSAQSSPSHTADDTKLQVCCDDDLPACVEENVEVETLEITSSDPSVGAGNDQPNSPLPPSPSPPPLRPLNLTSSNHCSELLSPAGVCPSLPGGSSEVDNIISANRKPPSEFQPKVPCFPSAEMSGSRQDFLLHDPEVGDDKGDPGTKQSPPAHAAEVAKRHISQSEQKAEAVDLVVNWKSQNSATNDLEIHNGEPHMKIGDRNCLSPPLDMSAPNHNPDNRSINDCSMEKTREKSASIIIESDECLPCTAESRPSKKLKTFHRESE